jgi:hypothetical protein
MKAIEMLEIVAKVRHNDPNSPTTATERYGKRAIIFYYNLEN